MRADAEPIAGDENPETYGVPIASLHADHVAADNTRIVNYKYAARQLLPPSRIPGFIFHQTERTADNGTNPCFGNSALCFDNNTRDFDLLGYKYSLLSTVGTAGLNNVVTMIPARDPTEFALFPAADRAFIRQWLEWTDVHAEYLANTAPIATLPPPGLGVVDGTCAMLRDEGFLFLFNPSMRPLSVRLILDESVGISNASAARFFHVSEMFPRVLPLGRYSHAQTLTVALEGSSALVLSVLLATDHAARGPPIVGLTGRLRSPPSAASAPLEWEGAEGVPGNTVTATVSPELLANASAGIRVNGVECSSLVAARPNGPLTLAVTFKEGPVVQHAQPLGPLPPRTNRGGRWRATFMVPTAVFAQLSARQAAYPVPWTAAEHNATWLVPSRLLAYVMIARPNDGWKINATIDGVAVPVHRSYNSRKRHRRGAVACRSPRSCLGRLLRDRALQPISSHLPFTIDDMSRCARVRLAATVPQAGSSARAAFLASTSIYPPLASPQTPTTRSRSSCHSSPLGRSRAPSLRTSTLRTLRP